jgi:hypothetical protein
VKTRAVLGWLAVAIATGMSSLWAFWGIIENFHEGWYSECLGENLGMLFFQYLSPFIVFLSLSVIALRWPLYGAAAYVITALSLRLLFFNGASSAATVMILVPMAVLATLFAFGRATPLKWAYRIVWVLPVLTLTVSAVQPLRMIIARDKEVDLRAQIVNGLVWAPAGPGWPDRGTSWEEARSICARMSEDGTTLASRPLNLWRLPRVEETVAAMMLHRERAGGEWNPARSIATYERVPDKEAPLWNPRSKVIYWWTGTEASPTKAYMIVYNGSVWPRERTSRAGYLGFRAVKEAKLPMK